MLRRIFIFVIVIISFCFVTFINSKIYCEEVKETTKVEKSSEENITLSPNVTKGEEKLAGKEYDVNLFTLIAKTIFSLIIITILIYLILRFFLKGQRWLIKQSGFIQIIATHSLAPNKHIQIVEIGNKLLVLGVSEHSINLLTEIVDKEVIDSIKIQSSKQEEKLQLSFIQHLKNRLQGQEIAQASYEEKLKFLNKQREKLKKLEL